MSKTAFRVSIPEPCHENWNAMSPQEKGRFCGVCTKTVVDFSVMSDAEMFDTLKNGAGKMCGHFHRDQLDRTVTAPVKPKWFFQPFWKYFVGLFLFLKPPAAKAQGKPVCTPVVPDKPYVKMGIVAVNPHIKKEKEISGKIVDAENKPVAGAIVAIKNIKRYVVSDQKGNFKIKAFTGDVLEISDLMYETTTFRVASENNISITLKAPERQFVDGEMVCVTVCSRVPPVELLFEVVDKETGKPVPDAIITWDELGNGEKYHAESTNKKGKAKSKTIWNQQEISFTVTAVGYNTNSIIHSNPDMNKKKTISLRIQLDKAVTPEILLPIAGIIEVVREPEVIKPPVNKEDKTVIEKAAFAIYPNPANKEEQVVLEFNSSKAETVMAQFTNVEGKILMNHRMEAAEGRNRVSVLLPAGTRSGTIVVKLMNSKGQWMATEKVVVL